MNGEIQPADVFAVVMRIKVILYVLCGLIGVQIAAKLILFSRVWVALKKVERLLCLAERHGSLTDRAVEAARSAAPAVLAAVERVPDKTADKVVQRMASGESNSGTNLPAVKPADEQLKQDNDRGWG